jgi:hypothetical protein
MTLVTPLERGLSRGIKYALWAGHQTDSTQAAGRWSPIAAPGTWDLGIVTSNQTGVHYKTLYGM